MIQITTSRLFLLDADKRAKINKDSRVKRCTDAFLHRSVERSSAISLQSGCAYIIAVLKIAGPMLRQLGFFMNVLMSQ